MNRNCKSGVWISEVLFEPDVPLYSTFVMLLLSRIIVRGSQKIFKPNHNFISELYFSCGQISSGNWRPACVVSSEHVCSVKCTDIMRAFSTSSSVTHSKSDSDSGEYVMDVDMTALTGGDAATEKRLKILMLEREVLKQEGFKVPTHMTTAHWQELLNLPTRSSRKKFLSYLFGVEKKKENRKRKKEEKIPVEEMDGDNDKSESADRITYGFRGSTIFLRIYDSTMDNFYNYNAIRAMMLGQKLVFDCSYDIHMTPRESKNCAKQLTLAFGDNRMNPDPFDLYLTGGSPDCRTLSYLKKCIPTMYDDIFPLNVTEKSYLDLFPKEKLVYLTPHCREELLEYDHDAVYIIGSMVDKVNNEPLSLAKAKREGLKMAKLPLDRYLDWGSGGGKSLTLNQMLNILLVQKNVGDWRKSLVYVPQRKLIEKPVAKSFKRNFTNSKINIRSLM
ncbi:mitochondrial ribonuclease P protein 1 homolog [Ischnura elegans]|uniref:mitochondrial ribonuclease P protein 1 homolog n=1 Tax=Ischnura elegans TaxID=197161 RepID=UPI001ED89E66|nr:mitochondrial ribonuclease P protein 1 homolog [Ischnura elegans]